MTGHYEYKVVPGFFIHDEADPPAQHEQVAPRFGLLDESAGRWTTFVDKIKRLNSEAEEGTSYKVFFVGRHGQGYHNFAIEKYTEKEWNRYWSTRTGDGELTWAPDPSLTDRGISEARAAHAGWESELASGLPYPEKLFCSPLRRTAQTCSFTFGDLKIKGGEEKYPWTKPVIMENLREKMDGHLCDQRSPLAEIRKEFPGLFDFEDGIEEEDVLFSKYSKQHEEDRDVARRVRTVLDTLFANESAVFVSVTAHSGWLNSFHDVIGRKRFAVVPGGVVPAVIKATHSK